MMNLTNTVKKMVSSTVLSIVLYGTPAKADDTTATQSYQQSVSKDAATIQHTLVPQSSDALDLKITPSTGFAYTSVHALSIDTTLLQTDAAITVDLDEDVALLLKNSVYSIDKHVDTAPALKRDYIMDNLVFGPKIRFSENLTVIPKYVFFSDLDHTNQKNGIARAGEQSHGIDAETYLKMSYAPSLELIGDLQYNFASDREHNSAVSGGIAEHFDRGFLLAKYTRAQDTYSKNSWNIGEARVRVTIIPEKELFIQLGGVVGDQHGVYGGLGLKPFAESNCAMPDISLEFNGSYLDDEKTRAHFKSMGFDLGFKF